MKQLIVTADDFGAFPSINKGITDAVLAGKVNSVAAFANYKDSVQNVKELLNVAGDKAEIGCHLTISSGEPLVVKNNPAFTNGKYFRPFTEIKITRIENQIAELEKELRAQVEIFLDNSIPVTNLSCHHTTLTYTEALCRVYAGIAERYKLPIRSVNVIPFGKDNLYRSVMQLMLIDDIPASRLREIKRFGESLSDFIRDNFSSLQSPDILESRHYGPAPGRDIWEVNVPRLVKKKRQEIEDFMQEMLSHENYRRAELMLHLIHYQTYLEGLDEEIDYPGVNKSYFDSRRLEFDSVMGFPFESYFDKVKLSGWRDIFPSA